MICQRPNWALLCARTQHLVNWRTNLIGPDGRCAYFPHFSALNDSRPRRGTPPLDTCMKTNYDHEFFRFSRSPIVIAPETGIEMLISGGGVRLVLKAVTIRVVVEEERP